MGESEWTREGAASAEEQAMSRTVHTLRCASWWGDWARMFHRENREYRLFGRRRREREAVQADLREMTSGDDTKETR
jgi:hypothetical protein